MQSFVKHWFLSLEKASKKDRKNIKDSFNKLPTDAKFEVSKLDSVLANYVPYNTANQQDKELCCMELNSFVVRGRPYLKLNISHAEYERLDRAMIQFR